MPATAPQAKDWPQSLPFWRLAGHQAAAAAVVVVVAAVVVAAADLVACRPSCLRVTSRYMARPRVTLRTLSSLRDLSVRRANKKFT
jgi:hypothetical protein